jgi:hypothetical protein
MNATEELRFVIVNSNSTDMDVDSQNTSRKEMSIIVYDPLTIFELLKSAGHNNLAIKENYNSDNLFVESGFCDADFGQADFGHDLNQHSLADSTPLHSQLNASGADLHCNSTSSYSSFVIPPQSLTLSACNDQDTLDFNLNDEISKIIDITIFNTNDKLVSSPSNSTQMGQQIGDMAEAMNRIYIDEVWEGCKKFVDKNGDVNAKRMVSVWKREKKSLAEVIETSLKEYADIYEKCTAVRHFFENEKQLFDSKVNSFNASKNSNKNIHDNLFNNKNSQYEQLNEDTHYNNYSKSRDSNGDNKATDYIYFGDTFIGDDGNFKKRKVFEDENVENKENYEIIAPSTTSHKRKMKKFNSPLKDI